MLFAKRATIWGGFLKEKTMSTIGNFEPLHIMFGSGASNTRSQANLYVDAFRRSICIHKNPLYAAVQRRHCLVQHPVTTILVLAVDAVPPRSKFLTGKTARLFYSNTDTQNFSDVQ